VHQERGPRAQALSEKDNLFSHCGPYNCDIVVTSAAIESCLRSGLFPADDPRLDGHFEVLEDVFLRIDRENGRGRRLLIRKANCGRTRSGDCPDFRGEDSKNAIAKRGEEP